MPNLIRLRPYAESAPQRKTKVLCLVTCTMRFSARRWTETMGLMVECPSHMDVHWTLEHRIAEFNAESRRRWNEVIESYKLVSYLPETFSPHFDSTGGFH